MYTLSGVHMFFFDYLIYLPAYACGSSKYGLS